MNKKVVSSILSLIVILISLFLLAACRPTDRVAMAAELPRKAGTVYAMDSVDLKLFNAAETSPAHVTAVVNPADRKFFTANYLGLQSADVTAVVNPADRKFFTANYLGLQSADVTAVVNPADRKFFTANYLGLQSADATPLHPADVMAYRWQAMAEGYEKAGLLNDSMDAGDVKAFRWLAIAHGYENLELLNHK
jgi:hypothetical protein